MNGNEVKKTIVAKVSDRLTKIAGSYAKTVCYGYCYEPKVPTQLLPQGNEKN